MTYYSPKWILVDFLRHRLTDPRERAETATSDTFTATASQTDFTVTPTTDYVFACVTSVTDNGSTMSKNEDYYVDLKNKKVIFFSGRTEGHTIIVNYKEGTKNWIVPTKPHEKLNRTNFPRISIKTISAPGKRLGNYQSDVEYLFHFQIDIWVKQVKEGEIFTIGGSKYGGNDLSEYLASEVIQAFKDHVSDLHPALYDYDPINGPKDMPFNTEYEWYHKIVEVRLKGVNSWTVDWK